MPREERVARAIAMALGYESGDWPDFALHARAALSEIAAMHEEAVAEFPVECDHEWRVPPDWQSGYCVKCGKSSTQR